RGRSCRGTWKQCQHGSSWPCAGTRPCAGNSCSWRLTWKPQAGRASGRWKYLPIRLDHGCLLLLCRNLLERYGREIKNLLSLREGSLSAGGGKEAGPSKQVLQAGGQVGIGTNAAVPGELGYPAAALQGCPTSAAPAPGGLGSEQEPPLRSPSPDGLSVSPETGSAAGEGEEGAAGHGDLAASEEGSEQLSSASGAKAAPPRAGSVPGAEPILSSWWAHREGSSAKLPVPAGAEEEARPSIPSLQQKQGRDAQAPEGSLLPPLNPPAAQEEPLDSSAPHRSGGMRAELQELCQALQLLEGLVERMSPRHRALYQGQPSGTVELPSACAGPSGLAQGDLEVMEAVVLRQLQAVSQSMQSGSLPLENTNEAVGRAGQEEHTRDTDTVRTLLSHHGLFLKQHQVQLPEQVAEMFEQLLASGEEEQERQTVLREALPGERGDEPPVQSDESSLGLPSIPTNGGEGKQGELAWQERGGDHSHDSPEGSDSLGTHLESSSLSNGSAPLFFRTELRKETVPAIKSKAFWGESDDSSSELEAALRPQTHSTDSDDFDDFYD
uniref:Centrosomal protein kizuna n=1 Tax=Zonotrichia albicollis TaxID=44394 RepID=A0A8D2MG91_ZONAL